MFQNLWNVAKAVLRGKFTSIQDYLRKQVKYQINNLTLYLREIEKEEQTNSKLVEERNNKIRVEINEIETKKNSRKDE